MSDRLREALERFYDSKRPNVDDEFVIADAARRFLALTETGPDYEAAIRIINGDGDDGMWGLSEIEPSLIRKAVDAALADYLTEEE